MKISFTPVELDGFTGNLTLVPDQNLIKTLDSNAPFTPDEHKEIGTFSLRGAQDRPLSLGNNSTLAISVSADIEWTLSIAWSVNDLPENINKAFKTPLSEDEFILYTSATFDTVNSANTKYPLFTYLSASAEAKANAHLGYHAAMVFPKTAASMDTLNHFIGSLHLPTNLSKVITSRSNLQALQLRGSLDLGAKLSLGYTISKQSSLTDNLPTLQAKASLAAHAGIQMHLGGCFILTTQSCVDKPDWINIRYHHGKSTQSNLRWGFDAGAKVNLGDIQSTEGLLEAITGVNPESTFQWIEAFSNSETKEDALKWLESKYSEEISDLTGNLVDKLFENKDFLKIADGCSQLVKDYNKLKSIIDEGALQWLWNTLKAEQIDKAIKQLEQIKSIKSCRTLVEIKQTEIWDIMEVISGHDAYELLRNPNAFTDLIKNTAGLLQILTGSGIDADLRKWMQEILQRLDIDKLMSYIQALTSPEGLQELLKKPEGKLCEMLFKLSDKVITEEVFQKTKAAAEKLIDFSNKLTEYLKDGFAKQLQVNLVKNVGNASKNDTLIDVDVDLSSQEGRSIAQALLEGNISDILSIEAAPYVNWNDCIWKKVRQSSNSIDINLLGWSYSCKSVVDQSSQTKIQLGNNGHIYLYDSETTLKISTEHGFRDKHAIDSTYGLQFTAKSKTDKNKELIGTPTLTNNYTLTDSDAGVTINELEQQLVFGKQLGMFLTADAPLNAWRKEWGDELPQSAELKYTINYTDGSFYDTLVKLGTIELINKSRNAIRNFFSYPYRHGNRFISPRELDAYMECDSVRQMTHGSGHHKVTSTIIRKDGETLMTIPNANSRILQAYKSEKDFLEEITDLSNLLKENPNTDSQEYVKQVNKAIYELMQVPQKYTQTVWCNNLFFLVIDALQLACYPNSRKGQCLLQADFSFKDGTKSTQFFTS